MVHSNLFTIGAPFSQLWSIYAFLQHGESVKQMPVALMSSASTDYYRAVLELITNILYPCLLMLVSFHCTLLGLPCCANYWITFKEHGFTAVFGLQNPGLSLREMSTQTMIVKDGTES